MFSVSRYCSTSSRAVTILRSTAIYSNNATVIAPRRTFSSLNSLWQKYIVPDKNILQGVTKGAIKAQAEVSSKAHNKKVGYWLLGCSGLVFVAVVLGYYITLYSVYNVVEKATDITKGGVTRLTESGLSMVTWRLLGEKMPRTEGEWVAEFEKYKQFPEFKMKNQDITLSQFKWIWHMEYGHRQWGRLIGAAYFIPATYFWMTGAFKKPMKIRIVVFGGLIAAQGLMGWYMVKSGLEDRFHGEADVPRVSQYRLAAHLSLALALYAGFLRSGLHVLLPPETIEAARAGSIKSFKRFRMFAHSMKGMVFLTAISGAFVAGLDAGLVYNSFPKMADKWIPDDVLALSPKLSNFTENPTTVQLDHRILGTTTLTLISILWLMSRKRVLPRRAHKAANALFAMAWLQVGLGITTLLTYVPISLAAMHQSGSLLLLSKALWLTHELKRLPK